MEGILCLFITADHRWHRASALRFLPLSPQKAHLHHFPVAERTLSTRSAKKKKKKLLKKDLMLSGLKSNVPWQDRGPFFGWGLHVSSLATREAAPSHAAFLLPLYLWNKFNAKFWALLLTLHDCWIAGFFGAEISQIYLDNFSSDLFSRRWEIRLNQPTSVRRGRQ